MVTLNNKRHRAHRPRSSGNAAAPDASRPFAFERPPGNAFTVAGCERYLNDLLELPPSEFQKIDLGLLNLLCAPTLPGSEHLDIAHLLARLDSLTTYVRDGIQRNFHHFATDAEHGHCEPMWRMGMLITFVKKNFGVAYNPSIRDEIDAGVPSHLTDSRDIFINGLLDDNRNRRWGTCASIPVLVTTVARRLGYPVYLVVAGRHVFARWDSGTPDGLKFNIEASNPAGMTILPDDEYREKITIRHPNEEGNSYDLRTLTPAEEFGLFLTLRAEALIVSARYEETLLWSARALQFAPDDPHFPHFAHYGLNLALKQRLRRAHPEQQIPADPAAAFFFQVGDLLNVEERCLHLTINAHYHEAKGELAEARTLYEDACRQNFRGNNEQRDLQRFLRKYDLPKQTAMLMPKTNGQPRRIQVRCKPEEEVTALRHLAAQFEQRGEFLKARDALHDLYLFDPSDTDVFNRARALERRPAFGRQLEAAIAKAREAMETAKSSGNNPPNPQLRSSDHGI